MPDAQDRIRGIFVSKVWPGHRDYEKDEENGRPRAGRKRVLRGGKRVEVNVPARETR